MAETITDVYIKLSQMFLITIIILILYRRKKEYKLHSLNWFLGVFLLADIQGLIELAIYVIKVYYLELENTAYFRFNEYHNIPYGLSIFVLYLFSEFMDRQQPHPVRFGLVIGSWFSYMSVMLYQTFNNYDIVFHDDVASHQSFNILFDIFQLIAMGITMYIFFKSVLNSENPRNRRVSFAVFIAFLLYVLALMYELAENLFGIPDIYGAITFSFTFMIMAFVYLTNPYYVYTVPHKIHRIVLAMHSGIHLYSAEIGVDRKNAADELLAGGVSAMTSFMAEAVGSKDSLKYAILGDRALIVSRQESLVAFIIADRPTRIINSALDQFVHEFIIEYKDKIQGFDANISKFDKAEEIITRCFPFIKGTESIASSSSKQE